MAVTTGAPSTAPGAAPTSEPGTSGSSSTGGPAAALAGSSAPAGTGDSLLRWALAWLVMLAILALLNRTRWGHTIIYYALLLSILLLALTQYQWIAWALQPFQNLNAAVNRGGSEQTTPRAKSNPGTTSGSEPGGNRAPSTGGAVDLTVPPVIAPWLANIPRIH